MVQPETADIALRKGQRSAVFPKIAMAQNNHSPDLLSPGEGHAQGLIGELQSVGETCRSELLRSVAPPRTLLVVDDQSSVCASIAYYLEVCGYRTFKAASGQAAVETYRREQIDGVLLDVQMPGMNGFQTCARLQALARETGRRFKVWFMTGIHYRELEEECAKAGGRAVFHKPFDWPQMLAELEQGLALLPPRSGPDLEIQSPSS